RWAAVAMALGGRLWAALRLLMRAVAPPTAVAPVGAPWQATASKAAAPALAAHGDVLFAWRFAEPADGRAQHLLDVLELSKIFGGHEGQRAPYLAGAAGAADAVDVVVRLPGHVEVEDVADVGDVEPACRHVACCQQGDAALTKGVERRHAAHLIHV